ncbi:anti-sigma factor family protein [Pseudomonadota bacterium]
MKSLSEGLFSAYVDGELDRKDQSKVEAWLAEHPEDRVRVEDYRQQMVQLHQLYDDVLNEPVPSRLKNKPATVYFSPQSLAASLVLLLVGFSTGWLIKPETPVPMVLMTPVTGAFGAHAIYTREKKHAVEVKAEEAHLLPWLSKRLGRGIASPNLKKFGFTLLGGRLMTEGRKPAAQLMYQNATGSRLTLYVSRGEKHNPGSFDFKEQDGLNAFYWQDRQTTFVLVGELERSLLLEMAESTYHQYQ